MSVDRGEARLRAAPLVAPAQGKGSVSKMFAAPTPVDDNRDTVVRVDGRAILVLLEDWASAIPGATTGVFTG